MSFQNSVQPGLAIAGNADIDTFYDTAVLAQNTGTLNFFPTNGAASLTDANYVNNPLPGNRVRTITGLSIESLIPLIQAEANVVPPRIAASLQDAVVEVTVDQNSQRLFSAPLAHFMDVQAKADDVIGVASRGFYRFPKAIKIGASQPFQIRIHFKDAAGFPTTAHWNTAGFPNGLRLRASIQTVTE